MTHDLKPWWGANGDYHYGMILVFAKSRREAKLLTHKHFPCEMDYIDVRVRRAEDKWMLFYDKFMPYMDSYPGDYKTWDEYWNKEIEPIVEE